MWRKSEEAKPSSKPADKPEGVAEIQRTDSQSAEPEPAAIPVANSFQGSADPPSPPALTPVAADSSPSQISAGLKIRGEITGTSDLLIEGDIQGKIQLTGCKLTVGPSGRIKSDIEAREINVYGVVSGNLKATESVVLGNTGRVEGSVITRRISIDDGARLRGKVEMVREEKAPASKPAVAATAAAAAAGAATPPAAASPAVKEKTNS